MGATYKAKGTGLQLSKTMSPAQMRPLNTAGMTKTNNPNREDMGKHGVNASKMPKGTRKGEY